MHVHISFYIIFTCVSILSVIKHTFPSILSRAESPVCCGSLYRCTHSKSVWPKVRTTCVCMYMCTYQCSARISLWGGGQYSILYGEGVGIAFSMGRGSV